MNYISWSSDFMLHLEDNLMYDYHSLGLWGLYDTAFYLQINGGLCDLYFIAHCRPRWLSWMRRPTGDQEVAGSTPAEVDNILSWRLIMKYFLRSFSPFR